MNNNKLKSLSLNHRDKWRDSIHVIQNQLLTINLLSQALNKFWIELEQLIEE